MNTLRVARAAARASAPSLRAPVQRRGYADAVADKIKLTLALPHQVRTSWSHHAFEPLAPQTAADISLGHLQVSGCVCASTRARIGGTVEPSSGDIDLRFDSVQVNIPAESGEMGILANHVASIEQLKPGLIEVIEESGGSKQFFRKLRDQGYRQQICD